MIKLLSQNRDHIFFGCLALVIVTLPFSIRVNSLAVVLLLAVWLFTGPISEKFLKLKDPVFLVFASLYLIHVVGMLWTSNIRNGLFELEKKSFLLALPLVLATTRPFSQEQVIRICWFFLIACVLASLFFLGYATYRSLATGTFYQVNEATHTTTYFFFYFGLTDVLKLHPGYLSLYIAFCFYFVIWRAFPRWHETAITSRVVVISLLLFFILMMILLSARLIIVAVVVIAVLFMAFKFIKRGKILTGIAALSLLMVLVLSAVLFTPVLRDRFKDVIGSSFQFKNDPEKNPDLAGKLDGVNMRLAKWYFAVEAGKDSWFAGQGTGDDQDALMNAYYVSKFWEGYYPKYNAHNQYLQTWLGLGIPGLLILIACFSASAIIAWQRQQFFFLTFIFLIIFFCATESVFCRQHGVVFYAFFNSLFAFHLK